MNERLERLIRPILYKFTARAALAVTALLLWNRWLNHGQRPLLRDGCLIAGVLFLCLCWFSYLKLDGFKIHHLLEKPEKKKKPKRRTFSDITDFADEHIVSFDELEPREQAICTLTSNAICAVIFLLLALIGAFI